MKIHLDIGSWEDGEIMVTKAVDGKITPNDAQSWFSGLVLDCLRHNKIDLCLLKSRWRWLCPKMRNYYDRHITRPLIDLKELGNRLLGYLPRCFERMDEENKNLGAEMMHFQTLRPVV